MRSVVDRNWATVCSPNTKGWIDIEQALARYELQSSSRRGRSYLGDEMLACGSVVAVDLARGSEMSTHAGRWLEKAGYCLGGVSSGSDDKT